MKKFIVDLLGRLPGNFGTKILMCINIFRRDWRMAIWPGYFSNFANIDKKEIEDTFSGLDEISQRTIRQYTDVVSAAIIHPQAVPFCFYDYTFIPQHERSRSEKRTLYREFRKALKKYRFPEIYAPGQESLLFHHGLRGLPSAVLKYISGKDFIDAGACFGDSALIFADNYSPGCIHSFEPSISNGTIFKRMLKANRVPEEKYILINAGLSSVCGELYFSDTAKSSTCLTDTGNTKAEITTLDRYLENKNITVGVIKADLEGMGLEMLKGAEETIKKHRPVLLLSIYHNPDELQGIFQTLQAWDLGYCIKIRSLHIEYTSVELTLIAFPEDLPAAQQRSEYSNTKL